MIGHDIGYAAQAACIPVGHIVKEVAGGLGTAGFEDLLLSAHGEPLGAPVRSILEKARPIVRLFTPVAVDEMGNTLHSPTGSCGLLVDSRTPQDSSGLPVDSS